MKGLLSFSLVFNEGSLGITVCPFLKRGANLTVQDNDGKVRK